jgi:NAD dependent epimerase/dehydratase
MAQNNLMLVTGADGFIGSHLTEHLLANGFRVRALVQYNSFNSYGWLDGVVHHNLEVVSGDVRDPFFCRRICREVDTVFHLAALIAIPYSYIAPQSYVETNVTGTLNMCQGALEAGVRRFLHTSTSEVYGTARFVPITEAHPLQPQSPYSASKIGADQMALSYYHAFGMHVTVVRPFNTYGPRQSARAVIPTIISQIASGKQKIALGDMRPTRDFNYVGDTAAGFAAIAQAEIEAGETINIASNFEVSIGDTLHTIARLMDAQIEVASEEERLRPQNSEVFRLWGDHSKLRALTGYTPNTSLEEGLSKTIEWFRNPLNLSRYKTGVYNV